MIDLKQNPQNQRLRFSQQNGKNTKLLGFLGLTKKKRKVFPGKLEEIYPYYKEEFIKILSEDEFVRINVKMKMRKIC